jgi:hypothetical protein
MDGREAVTLGMIEIYVATNVYPVLKETSKFPLALPTNKTKQKSSPPPLLSPFVKSRCSL